MVNVTRTVHDATLCHANDIAEAFWLMYYIMRMICNIALCHGDDLAKDFLSSGWVTTIFEQWDFSASVKVKHLTKRNDKIHVFSS